MRIFILLLFFYNSFCFGQQSILDSLEDVIISNAHDTLKTFAYSDLCWEYRQIDQPKAIRHGLKGVELSRNISYKTGEGKTLNDLAIIYIDLGKLDSAIILLNQSKTIRQKLGDNLGVAAIHNKLGIIYQNQNRLEKALHENIEALKIYEKNEIPQYITHVKNNIANIHFRLGDYDKAIEIHNETLKLRELNKDYVGVAQSYVNLANVYEQLKNTDLAIENYQKAIKIFEQEKEDKSLSFALNNLGSAYLSQKDYKNAKTNLEKALVIRKKIGDNKTICSTQILLGRLYAEQPQPNYAKSEQFLKNALKLNKKIQLNINEKDIYFELSNLYRLTNNVDSAFHYNTLYNQILNDEYLTKLNSKVSELQTIYETEKKEQEIELKNLKLNEEQLKSKQKNYWLLTLGASLLLIVVLALSIFRQQKLKQKSLVIESKLKARVAEEQLKNELHEERLRISRDLHDNIGSQLTFIISSVDNLKFSTQSKDEKLNKKLTNVSDFTRTTISQLRDTIWAMNKDQISLESLKRRLLNYIEKANITQSNIDFSFEADSDSNIFFNSKQGIGLFRIVQEAINNSLKYSSASKITCAVKENKNEITVSVTDDGIGFEISEVNLGNGLNNMHARAKIIQANLVINSSPASGTEIRLTLNKDKLNAV